MSRLQLVAALAVALTLGACADSDSPAGPVADGEAMSLQLDQQAAAVADSARVGCRSSPWTSWNNRSRAAGTSWLKSLSRLMMSPWGQSGHTGLRALRAGGCLSASINGTSVNGTSVFAGR
jgi:hypothetical protein